LNRLPEVKKFLKEHIPDYDNVSVDWVHGAPPVAYFYDSEGKQVESIDLARYSTNEIISLLAEKGFTKRNATPPPTPEVSELEAEINSESTAEEVPASGERVTDEL